MYLFPFDFSVGRPDSDERFTMLGILDARRVLFLALGTQLTMRIRELGFFGVGLLLTSALSPSWLSLASCYVAQLAKKHLDMNLNGERLQYKRALLTRQW